MKIIERKIFEVHLHTSTAPAVTTASQNDLISRDLGQNLFIPVRHLSLAPNHPDLIVEEEKSQSSDNESPEYCV